MKIFKTILNIILSFLLIILIAMSIVINILQDKILNKDYILSKMEENQVYLQVSREVDNGFENYIYQSGLPEDIIKDLYTEDTIKNDVNSFINALYDGTEIQISDSIIRETLDKRINEYLVSENKTLNEQGKKNVEKFEDLIVNEYKNNVNAYGSLYKTGHEFLDKLEQVIQKIKFIPIILIIAFIIFLIVNNLKNLLLTINYACISLLSLGILIKIGVSIIFSKINIDNILFITKALSNLLINISKEILYICSDYANLFIVIGIVGILIYAIADNVKKVDVNTAKEYKNKEDQNAVDKKEHKKKEFRKKETKVRRRRSSKK
ncbi:MAG TPA: hypothetical protein IAD08_01380 [Candidatus Scatovivens faecipullorum]|nr:hypothetical protein [Candidatus Scatovivens faecipullorum]